jgi:23S rRNA pseudouridine1911/1915/1917 synthase
MSASLSYNGAQVRIFLEDNHVLVVEKPPGLLSQADASGAPDLLTLAKAYIKEKYAKPGEVFLALVHRLDRSVGGPMVFARTSKAAARLSEQFRERTVRKIYQALVEGALQPTRGRIVGYMKKNEASRQAQAAAADEPGAQLAELEYEALWSSPAVAAQLVLLPAARGGLPDAISCVEIGLETGRFHQIRFQLASRGAPILGDRKYGAHCALSTKNLALWCVRLEFEHPVRHNRVSIDSAPPDEFRTLSTARDQ